MPHAVLPDQVSPELFSEYTKSWQTLEGADTNAITACFMSNDSRLNYVYLNQAQVVSLLESGTTKICAKFALVPRQPGSGNQSDSGKVFAMIFYSDDSNSVPASGFQLSGVAGVAADIEEDLNFITNILSCIPLKDAADGVRSWEQAAASNLAIDLFTTKLKRLRGYTHAAADFLEAMLQPSPPALWLNFALHSDANNPGKQIFDTVLSRNVVPEADAPGTILLSPRLLYYDVANPCPPACGIIDRV